MFSAYFYCEINWTHKKSGLFLEFQEENYKKKTRQFWENFNGKTEEFRELRFSHTEENEFSATGYWSIKNSNYWYNKAQIWLKIINNVYNQNLLKPPVIVYGTLNFNYWSKMMLLIADNKHSPIPWFWKTLAVNFTDGDLGFISSRFGAFSVSR